MGICPSKWYILFKFLFFLNSHNTCQNHVNNFRQLMIVGFIGDVDHDDVQGDPTQTAWMIWNTADPMTTDTNSAISSGLTGYLSSVLEDLVTLPLFITFFAFFSLA